jgi:hypothetical protein
MSHGIKGSCKSEYHVGSVRRKIIEEKNENIKKLCKISCFSLSVMKMSDVSAGRGH